MSTRRTLAAAAVTAALITGTTTAAAAAAPPSPVTVAQQAAVNRTALDMVGQFCGRWHENMTDRQMNCRHKHLSAWGYASPWRWRWAPVPSATSAVTYRDPVQRAQASGLSLARQAAADASAVDVNGDGVLSVAEQKRARTGVR